MQIINMRSVNGHKNSELDIRGRFANFYTSRVLVWILSYVLCLICLCSTVNADDYYAGQTYTFNTPSYSGYLYLWTAVDEPGNPVGSSPDYTKGTFVWTAPAKAQKVIISVVVASNWLESCKDMDQFPIDVLPLAGITVVKEAVPNDPQDFEFVGNRDIGSFTLRDDGSNDPDHPPSRTFANLTPGQDYIISEPDTIGWDLTSLAVTNLGTSMAKGSTDGITYHAGILSGDRFAQITLGAGESPVITYTNTKRQIDLAVAVTADETACCGEPTNYRITLRNNNQNFEAINIVVKDILDVNTVFELATPGAGTFDKDKMNWTIPSLAAGATATLDLVATCSPTYMGAITNQVQIVSFDLMENDPDTSNNAATANTLVKGCGSITIIKDAIPIGAPEEEYSNQVFTFSSDTLGPFPLVDNGTGQSNSITFDNLKPGDYKIVEQPQSGWTLNFINGSDTISKDVNDENGTLIGKLVHLGINDEETITFVNAKSTGQQPGGASITVIKDAIPVDEDYSTQQFAFSSDALGPFTLVDDGTGQSDSIVFRNLEPGDYKIVEQPQSGWTLNSVIGNDTISENVNGENENLIGKLVHLGINDGETITFVNTQSTGPLPPIGPPLTIKKTALNTSVHRGEEISYTIEVCNIGFLPLYNVTVVDVLPKGIDLIFTSPGPTTGLTWHVGTLDPKGGVMDHFDIALTVRVPITDFHYDMSQGVKGEGFVNVYSNYDTTVNPSFIENCAYATADGVGTVSDCANTTVIEEPGTELKRREFGSGVYASEELSKVRSENKSIISDTSLRASYRPSSFSLPQGRSINYNTLWTEKSKARNTVTGASMTEEYTSATKINKERSLELDKNGSTMTTEVEFVGQGHIGVLKKEAPDSHPKVKTIFESREDYAGSFKIYEKVDEYGSSVVSNKSTSGFGYVAVDKKIRDSQKTYESGTGSYQREELIDTPTSYMAKNISLVHAPANYSYSPSFIADQDMKWSEGMWSKSGGLSGANLVTDTGPSRQLAASSCLANGTSPGTLISEKYSYLDNLQKETVASGLNEMKTEVSFSGMADYRVLSHGTNGTSEVDKEERYAGSYDINRHVLLTGTSKYDMPHLTVIKEGQIRNEWYNKVNATLAEYTIKIINDGNRALAPIYVRDLLPTGTQYIKSTIRPASLNASEANWTLVHLGIGDTITIGLTLNVTEAAEGNNIVNRVVACGISGDKSVCAGNYSSLEFGWLTCCQPEVLLSKKAWLDEADPTVVHYRIIVNNKAQDSVAVTVTDQLPGGMTLLGASVGPNTYDANLIVWALPEIKSGRIETIDYTTRALRDGGYTSTVHIDATAINGTGYDTMDASAYIEVTRTGVAAKTFRYGGWEPPAWNLSAPEPGLNMDPVLEFGQHP